MSGRSRLAVAFATAAIAILAPFASSAAAPAPASNDNRASQTQQQPAPPQLEPQTQLSRRDRELTELFNREARDVHIVMMDRDWFRLNQALAQTAPDDIKTRTKLIADFIESRTGHPVDPARLRDLVDAVTQGGGFTLPQDTGPSEGLGDGGFCTVFGQFPDIDADSYARMLAGMNDRFHPGLAGREMQNIPSLEAFQKWVDYHEAGHCLYEGPHQGDYESFEDYVIHRHKSEMYGDVFAALMLARQDGVTNFAEQAARLRLVADALNGPAAARLVSPGEFRHYTAFMYTVHDGLRDAQREIDTRGVNGLRHMSMNQIRELANRIVERNALDSKKSVMIRLMQANLYDTAQMDQLRHEDPSYEEAYQYALRLRDDMNRALPQVIDMRGMDANRTPLQQVGFDFRALMREPLPPSLAQQIAMEQRTNELRDRMVQMAGGTHATPQTLNRAFSQMTDSLRATLHTGNAAERKAAMNDLSLMEDAVMRAAKQIAGPGAAPATQPASTPAPQTFRPLPQGGTPIPGVYF